MPTAKKTVISPDFLVWKFCGKAQFPHSFERLARNFTETVSFRQISTPGNQVKLRYFPQLPWLRKHVMIRFSLAILTYYFIPQSKNCKTDGITSGNYNVINSNRRCKSAVSEAVTRGVL